MSSLKFCILTQYYPPEMGAPQGRLHQLATHLVESGHKVTILTAMPNYPTGRVFPGYGGVFQREDQDSICVLRAPIYPSKSTRPVIRLFSYFSFVLSSLIIGIFKLPKVDYLITESPPLFLGISGYLLSRLKGAQWIFNVSDLWPESAVRLGWAKDGWSLWFAQKLEAFCYRKAFLVMGQSKEIIADIERRFHEIPTYHLSNGVDTQLFYPHPRLDIAREYFPYDTTCIAVYAGLHGVAQGLDQLLDAALYLRDLEDLMIVFVGDGPEKERLIRRADWLQLTNVRFMEPYPRHSMPNLLASADIALVPLKTYLPGAVPSKIYEAMGVGLPIILCALGEASDIVKEARAGIVITPGDVAALATSLRDLMANPERRRQLGANGRWAAVNKFDRSRITYSFLQYLEASR